MGGILLGRHRLHTAVRRVHAHDDPVLQRRVANGSGQQVIHEAICRNKPGRGRSIHENQQHADEAEGNQAVPVFFSCFVQGQTSLHNAGSIEKRKVY